MNALWSLPRAAPFLLRHLIAYGDLAVQDLARTHAHFSSRITAAIIFALSGFFAVLMTCTAIVAANWDTPHRMISIYSLAGFFVLVAVIAGFYASRMRLAQPPLFAEVRREWQIDRPILERILSGHESPAGHEPVTARADPKSDERSR